MDARLGPAELQLKQEFYLRPMKSPRQRATAAAAMAMLMLLLPLQAQKPDNPVPAQSAKPQAPPAHQAPPATSSQDAGQKPPVIRVPVNQVVIPVTVKDGDGRLVADLGRGDFRIFEDNVEQKIAFFSAEAAPLSIILLIDNDLKSKDAEQVEASLRAVLSGLSNVDEVFICRFDQFFHEGHGFTTDQDRLLTELKRMPLDESRPTVAPPSAAINNGPSINGHSATSDAPNITGALRNIKGQPTKALDDAVYTSAQLLRDRGRDRRKIIVLISDGQNGIRANKVSYDDAVKELLRTGISVYSVAVGSAFFDRKFNRLVNYAHASGGEVYFAAKQNTMEELYAQVTEEARHQYTLAYSPSGTDKGKDYHEIDVRVERPGLKVVARQGYYTSGIAR
jgi:Ca-activated chloride channel homolog